MKKATERFSDKVDSYVKYRPGYPHEVIEFLQSQANLKDHSTIVDIGSGTGIFTRQLLDAGYKVFAVEPNGEMREAAEQLLRNYSDFISIAGSGEYTTLSDNIADLIVCATAFHWIDPVKAKVEFARVLKSSENQLKSSKNVALIWNIRQPDADQFSIEYEKFWQSYDRSGKQDVSEPQLGSFFFDGIFQAKSFTHAQSFDLPGLIGRSFSSSFSPKDGTNEATEFREKITELFSRYEHENSIKVHYTAKVYIGTV